MRTVSGVARQLFTETNGHLDGDAISKALGGVLLIATGADHLDLYLTGYRSIPTIGWMFLVQVLSAFTLGMALLALVVARETAGQRAFAFLSWQQVVSASGAALTGATLFLYLVSLRFGVFGYHEIRTVAGIFAATLEIATFILLGRVACEGLRPGNPSGTIRAVVVTLAATLTIVAEAAAVLPAAPTGQLAAVGRTGIQAAADPPAGTATVTIVIQGFAFKPADPVVRPGEEIVVVNKDSVAHTFSSASSVPAADAFTSGAVQPGRSVRMRAPSQPGRYPYICLIHPFMTGILVVSATG